MLLYVRVLGCSTYCTTVGILKCGSCLTRVLAQKVQTIMASKLQLHSPQFSSPEHARKMTKRTAPAVDGEVQPEKRLPKRQKLDAPRGPPPKAEEIHNGRQLQQLLVFQQDNTQQLRNGARAYSFEHELD